MKAIAKSFAPYFKIGKDTVGEDAPAYFIAEIGANFDGSIDKAKQLAKEAKECGAQCAKIQSFKAKKIVSRRGFASMKLKGVHGSWSRPVDEVFQDAEFPREWHKKFFEYCWKIGITPSTAAYDYEAIELVEKIGIEFYKIGSGEITWLEALEYTAKKGKPVMLATGDSTLSEVDEAVRTIERTGNQNFVLMQCITNYPSMIESANINVLDTYKKAFNCIVGYSDHSPGDVVALGAVAKGAKVIEKHFTLNKKDKGPDHPHSMEPQAMADLIAKARKLEAAMGSSRKFVVEEESETVIVQRRGLTAAKNIKKGQTFGKTDIVELRPALGIPPKYKSVVVGKMAKKALQAGDPIRWEDVA